MDSGIKKLIDRAAENLRSLDSKKWEEITPEDFGKVCGDLAGIMTFVMAMDAIGAFDQNKELAKRVTEVENRFASITTLAEEWIKTAENRPVGMSNGFAEGLAYCAKKMLESIQRSKIATTNAAITTT